MFCFFIRFLFFLLGSNIFIFFWRPLFFFVSAGSIVVGALGALTQTKIKRFIGYASINQMGYLFLGLSSGSLLGLQSVFLYLFFYLSMVFCFFTIVLHLKDLRTGRELLFLNQLSGFAQAHNSFSLVLALVLFSMAGVPPFVGFFGKFFLFWATFKAGNFGLIALGLIMSVVSAFYYLRIIKAIFFAEPHEYEYSTYGGWNPLMAFILSFFVFILLFGPFFIERLWFKTYCLSHSAAFSLF